MKHRPRHLGVAVLATLCLATAGPSMASPAPPEGAGLRGAEPPQHEYTVNRQSVRGDIYVCGGLKLRATRGYLTETTDADLRNGLVHISTSRIWHGVRLRGSDGLVYRASSVTAAWFVLRAPDFETPVHGLEVNQVMFRGGPDQSPGWIRERIRWVDKHDTDIVDGPCTFGD